MVRNSLSIACPASGIPASASEAFCKDSLMVAVESGWTVARLQSEVDAAIASEHQASTESEVDNQIALAFLAGALGGLRHSCFTKKRTGVSMSEKRKT
jgi:NAD(P)H-nitrite reductase large subunit